ncbi:Eukaryotic initiation factor 4A-II [Mortierella sp. NVP85]|nr:Eukaryotic initiation factor 4A-II [Mortierella sp. NVP85]
MHALKVTLALGNPKIQCHICTDRAHIREDKMRLEKGAHIVVGTPSYVQEIISHRALMTTNIRVLILDRVDEMISEGSKDAIEELFQTIPRSTQVVFLLNKTFAALKDMTVKFMHNPVWISHTEETDLDDSETLTDPGHRSDDKLYEMESNQDEVVGKHDKLIDIQDQIINIQNGAIDIQSNVIDILVIDTRSKAIDIQNDIIDIQNEVTGVQSKTTGFQSKATGIQGKATAIQSKVIDIMGELVDSQDELVNIQDKTTDNQDEIVDNQDETVIDSFDGMNLKPDLLRGITAYGLERPSAFQRRIMLPILNNQDVVIEAKVGPDRLTALAISALQKLNPGNKNCQVLILSPAPELAQQIQEPIQAIGTHMNIQCRVCVGGTDFKADIENIKKGCHVVVGTWGRLQDLIKKRILRTNSLKMFVMDGLFYEKLMEEINEIFQRFPPRAQVVFLANKGHNKAEELMDKLARQPTTIMANKDELRLEDVKQFFVTVEKAVHKLETLCSLCEKIAATHIVVFCNAAKTVDWLKEKLTAKKITAEAIRGSMGQAKREEIMKDFSSGSIRVLISTDQVLNENDAKEASLVINFELPPSKKTYINRIGLAGRYNKGVGINIVPISDVARIRKIEHLCSTRIQEMSVKDPA